MDVAQFRESFPEFADANRFPDPVVTMWLTVGEAQVSAERFGGVYDQALGLFTAHNVLITSNSGAAGAIHQKKVGAVTVQYDNMGAMLPGAGHWNQTSYGRQFAQMLRLFGAGCVQL